MSTETYSERQAKKGRPVSPHVTIYKFPVVALSSITNRVTGVALSAGVTGIGLLSLGNVDIASLMTTIGNVTFLGTVAKAAVTFPIAFHYFGGVRHVLWDRMPEALENDQVESSSYTVLGASVAVTAIAALFL
jgi:succinate dehydrogenase (ubiquinone) cytochrome b560 subunit